MPSGAGADLYSPFMAAAIIDRQGNRYPLWTNINEVGQPNVAGKASANNSGKVSLPFVTALSVEYQLAYLPIITATFSPPYDDAIALLDSPMIEWGASSIQVQFGYTAGAPGGPLLSPIFEGTLLKPDITLGETIEITFRGQGVGAFSATRQVGNKSLQHQTPIQIINALAQGPGGSGNPNRDFTVDFSKAQQDSAANTALTTPMDDFQQGNRTDYMAIWDLIQQSGCWAYFQGSTLVVTARNASLIAQPNFTLSYFDMGGFSQGDGTYAPPGMLDPSKGQYPIFTASSPQMALYMAGAVRGLVMQDISDSMGTPNTMVVNQASVSPANVGGSKNSKSEPNADNIFPGMNPDNGSGGDTFFGNPEDAQNVTRANAKFAQVTSLMGIPLSVTTPGIPTMIPGDTVKVQGLGGRLTANYAVFKIIHHIGTDGYTSDLEMVGNLSALTQGVAPSGQTNVQNPSSSGGGPSATAGPNIP
jgi:hypothetical protein